MIPKTIHYCWFGGKELPPLAKKCIDSWKKFMPDYEVKEWNENNFDVNSIPYTSQAYKAKKFAFVSDYARFFILNNEGGIYMDVDVEIIKPLDEIIDGNIILGYEQHGAVNPGLIMVSPKNQPFLIEMLKMYKDLSFICPEGKLNLTTIVQYTTDSLKKKNLKDDNIFQQIGNIKVYPSEYFCPINMITNKLVITGNTFTIHHYAASWLSPLGKFKKRIRKIIGYRFYDFLYKLKAKVKNSRKGSND